jgi:hypothetical protein
MYQIIFSLKQYTPLIHFQHDQDGATLRASEIKPKLDRFILINLGKEIKPTESNLDILYKEGIKKAKSNSWLIGNGDHPALNYKLKILPVDSNQLIVANRMSGGNPGQSKVLKDNGYDSIENSSYFALEKQIGDLFENEKYKEFIGGREKMVNHFSLKSDFAIRINQLPVMGLLSTNKIEIKISCNHKNLSDSLSASLKNFFCSHNFGTRQTKGFGCFLPDNITETEIINCLKHNPEVKGVFKVADRSDFKSKLGRISKDYTLLKRGDSFNVYIKSKLWEYLCANNKINWEKKAIKMHIKANNRTLFNSLKYDDKNPVHRTDHHIDSCVNENTDYYIRALLGLAEQYEFAKKFGNDRIKVKIDDSLSLSTDTFLKEKTIDRFQSPIRYFITDTAIFLVTTAIPDELMFYSHKGGTRQRRKFRFTIGAMNTNNYIELEVPNVFNLEDFIGRNANYGKNLK